jgi:hypothetical protein
MMRETLCRYEAMVEMDRNTKLLLYSKPCSPLTSCFTRFQSNICDYTLVAKLPSDGHVCRWSLMILSPHQQQSSVYAQRDLLLNFHDQALFSVRSAACPQGMPCSMHSHFLRPTSTKVSPLLEPFFFYIAAS